MRTAIWFIRALVIALIASLHASVSFAAADTLLVEAEQFSMLGGWDLDQQSMDQMGSPYLLAHGLGKPVADASCSMRSASFRLEYVCACERRYRIMAVLLARATTTR